jgi:transcriptional regulator with XRE-family HTH domain
MSPEVLQLIRTLKQQLRARNLTYRDVAHALKLSEASIKRIFATQRFTVTRLAQIARFAGLSLVELMQLASDSAPLLDTLTEDQEMQLVADAKLLLVAVCALNHWSLPDILNFYRLTSAEAVKRLRTLDRMGIIELLPGERIRRRTKRDFDWLPRGPIRRYFEREGIGEFVSGRFDGEHESLEFAHGMLTSAAQAELKIELRRLRGKLAALHEQSVPADMREKHGVAILLGLRRWEPMAFRRLRRVP